MAFDVAQICLNGHVVNPSMEAQPGRAKRHCEKCGERTMTSCMACGNAIPGEETISEAAALAGYHAPDYARPAFCSSCGKPYPWTDRSLHAARELASEMEGLSEADRE